MFVTCFACALPITLEEQQRGLHAATSVEMRPPVWIARCSFRLAKASFRNVRKTRHVTSGTFLPQICCRRFALLPPLARRSAFSCHAIEVLPVRARGSLSQARLDRRDNGQMSPKWLSIGSRRAISRARGPLLTGEGVHAKAKPQFHGTICPSGVRAEAEPQFRAILTAGGKTRKRLHAHATQGCILY